MLNENKTIKTSKTKKGSLPNGVLTYDSHYPAFSTSACAFVRVVGEVTPLPFLEAFALAFRLSFCTGPLSLAFLLGALGVKSKSNSLRRNSSTNEKRVANVVKAKAGAIFL